MDKDMTNNSIEFDVNEEGEFPPRWYKDMKAHMIFEVNLDAEFTPKMGITG